MLTPANSAEALGREQRLTSDTREPNCSDARSRASGNSEQMPRLLSLHGGGQAEPANTRTREGLLQQPAPPASAAFAAKSTEEHITSRCTVTSDLP